MRKLLLYLLISLLALSQSTCGAKVVRYSIKVIKEYPHSSSAYTQGLFFHDTKLCESSGGYGTSSFRKLDPVTCAELFRLDFNSKYFLEGSAVLDGKLYILTWRENFVFVYDFMSMKQLPGISYPREGWGLTTDGQSLIASDGSSTLYFMDKDLRQKRNVTVTMGGEKVPLLNELEWIDGRIWANVYTTEKILIINPSDGVVEGIIDCSGLLPDYLRTSETDVLNGIAQDPSDGAIYLTGKNWPAMFRIELTR